MEEKEEKVFDITLIKRLYPYIKPNLRYFIISVALIVGVSLLELVLPYMSKLAIDNYILRKDWNGLTRIALLYIGILLIIFFFRYFQTITVSVLGQKAMYFLRMDIFKKYQNLDIKFYDTNPVGKILTRITSDIDALNEMLSDVLVGIFGDIFLIIGVLVAIFLLNWRLALISLAFLPILVLAVWIFRIKARETYRNVRSWISTMNAYLQENIMGIKVIQIFTREMENKKRFKDINTSLYKAQIASIMVYAIFYPAVEVLGASVVALILWYGGSKILSGAMTFGSLLAFMTYLERFFYPIRDLSEKYNIMQSAMAAAEKVFGLLDTPIVVTSPTNSPVLIKGDVEFRNVSFAYDDEYVLKNLSFHVYPGEHVAFVGATGAGKSSIMNLILRFYDIQNGEILIDGYNIKDILFSSLRRQIAVVLQEPVLFSGTIAENIRMGEDIPLEEIITASKRVGLHQFVERMRKGYNEGVMERGANLSAGERQLICLARALVFDPKILILDEATSSIDLQTERLIQQATEELMKGRTSLIIAHRLSTIVGADRIYVLNKGKLVEVGTHNELTQRRGMYWQLYRWQQWEKKAIAVNPKDPIK